MDVQQFWGITFRNGKFRGQLRVVESKMYTGSYVTVFEAAKALDRCFTPPPRAPTLRPSCDRWLRSVAQAAQRRCSAQPAFACRLIYKTNSPQALQVGLSDAEKLWLDTHSLDDLKLDFKRACIKTGGGGSSSSAFRGVHKMKNGKFETRVRKRVAGRNEFLFCQQYDNEEAAARAYDRVALQLRGRCALVLRSFTRSSDQSSWCG